MKKVLFSLLMIISLMIINCNVKAYDLTSLTNSDYKVTINSVNVNLYPLPDDSEELTQMYANPITLTVPLSESGLNITGDSLVNKNLDLTNNTKLNIDLINLENNFTKEEFSEFLESQSFDKTKRYYGDIDVTYTISDYPTKYKTFIEYNAFRTMLKALSELFRTDDDSEGTSFTLAKPAYTTISLDGSPITTTQTVNFFTYGSLDADDVEPIDKLFYSENALDDGTGVEADELYSATSTMGIYALNFGVFSEEDTFDGETFKSTDKAILLSTMQNMDTYIDNVNKIDYDDYIESEIENQVKKAGNHVGTMVAKVPNTKADSNKISILVGLILLLAGGLVVKNIIERKRYN